MAAPSEPQDLAVAVAQGDIHLVKSLLAKACDINKASTDGMSPLSIAAFWGYAHIANILLDHGADVNLQNTGTGWSALHCAAFQGHGPVVMKLMAHHPDLAIQDIRGRTAADFASALDSIWPFFAAARCRRTPKSQLIAMDIVHKVTHNDASVPPEDLAHFSRPGSSYAMRSQTTERSRDPRRDVAAITGDVLASLPEEPSLHRNARTMSLLVWDN